MSATVVSYESHVEMVHIFCQTINHTNHKAIQEKNRCKVLQADFQKTRGRGHGGCQTNGGGPTDTGGHNEGCGRAQGHGGRSSGHGRTPGCYHNWMPHEQFDNLSNEEYQTLIHDRVLRGKLQAHNADTDVSPPTVPPVGSSVSIPHAHAPTPSTPDASTVTDVPTYRTPSIPPRSVSMALVTPSSPVGGTTTSPQMDSGPNTLLCQLMTNASTRTQNTHGPIPRDDNTPIPRHHINHVSYRVTTQDRQAPYPGALMDSGANGGMAGFDTCLLATVPHAHVDITGVGGDILQWLPLIQCASMVDTIDEGPIILILSQYAHKPDAKTIHLKSQVEHFGGSVYDSALSFGGQQMVVTHEGYAIPLHVCDGFCIIWT